MSITHTLNIEERFVDSDHTSYNASCCYFILQSEVDTKIRQIPQDKEETDAFAGEIIDQIFYGHQRGQVTLKVDHGNEVYILESKMGGICVDLGFEDYSDHTEINHQLKNLVHQYNDGESCYLTIVNLEIARHARKTAITLFEKVTGVSPIDVYLRISSKPGNNSFVTNETPNGDEASRFIKITEIQE
jgi:hypothetical protein